MDIEQRIQKLEREMREHYHNGVVGRQLYIRDIFGLFETVTSAGDLALKLAGNPKSIYQQIFIDASTGSRKLYMYDSMGLSNGVWRSISFDVISSLSPSLSPSKSPSKSPSVSPS